MTPDWPKLHTRCPELRPRCGTMTMWLVWVTDPEDGMNGHWSWEQVEGRHRGSFTTGELQETAADLCFAAAVRWLAQLDEGALMLTHSLTCGWSMQNHSEHGGVTPPGQYGWPTADECLRANCAAILDARDAAKGGAP